jgi:hypothetical protein
MINHTPIKRKIVWLLCWALRKINETFKEKYCYVIYIEHEFLDNGFWRA